jgi:hypothetical protein
MARTINEAIIEVLKMEGKPLLPKEIFAKIKDSRLYHFKAQNPENIVRNQLKRHSENTIKLAAASKVKHFVCLDDGKYWLKGDK